MNALSAGWPTISSFILTILITSYSIAAEPIDWPKYHRSELLNEFGSCVGKDVSRQADADKFETILTTIGIEIQKDESLDNRIRQLLEEVYGDSAAIFWQKMDQPENLIEIKKYLTNFPEYTILPTAEISSQLRKAVCPDVQSQYVIYALELLKQKKGQLHPLLLIEMQRLFTKNKQIYQLEYLASQIVMEGNKQGKNQHFAPMISKVARELRLQNIRELSEKAKMENDHYNVERLKEIYSESKIFLEKYSAYKNECEIAGYYLKFAICSHLDELSTNREKHKDTINAYDIQFDKIGNKITVFDEGIGVTQRQIKSIASKIGLIIFLKNTYESVLLDDERLNGENRKEFERNLFDIKKLLAINGLREELQTQHDEQLKALAEIKSEIKDSTILILQGLEATQSQIQQLQTATEKGFQVIHTDLVKIEKTNTEILNVAQRNSDTLTKIQKGIETTNEKLNQTNDKLDSIDGQLKYMGTQLQDIQNQVRKSRKDSKWWQVQNQFKQGVNVVENIYIKGRDQILKVLESIYPFPITVYHFEIQLKCSYRIGTEYPSITVQGPAGIGLNGSAMADVLAGKSGNLFESLKVNWDEVVPAMYGIKIVKETNYSEVCTLIRQEHEGGAIYFCSSEFVETFGPTKVGELVAAYLTGTLQQEIESIVRILQKEVEQFLSWVESTASQTGNTLAKNFQKEFPNILIDAIQNGDLNLAKLIPQLKLKWLNLSGGDKKSDRKFSMSVRAEGAGMMRVPINWLTQALKKPKIGNLKIPENVHLPHLGYALVLSSEQSNSLPRFHLLNKLPDWSLLSQEEQMSLFSKTIHASLLTSQSKIESQFDANSLTKKVLVEPIKQVNKTAGDEFERLVISLDNSKNILPQIIENFGLSQFSQQVLKINPQDLLAALTDSNSKLDLMKLQLHKDLEALLKKIAIGNSTGSTKVKKMTFDLETGSFNIEAVIVCEQKWNGIGELPNQFKHFLAGLSF
tara:strand:+ start:52484 stop:55411 length:2928 start_codon:yes stop_codon:yes gene_type:complete